ncbi:MAG: hypothetical protein AAF623_07450 [Planctomycetota bacterium]
MKRTRKNANFGSPVLILAGLALIATTIFSLGCAALKKPVSSISQPANSVANLAKIENSESLSIGDRADAATQKAVISNPLAKEIRFNGQELVLGSGNCQALSSGDLTKVVRGLLDANKRRSAAAMAGLHIRSAERMLVDSVGNSTGNVETFVAAVLDHGKPEAIWATHLKNCKARPTSAKLFAAAKQQIVSGGASTETVQSSAQQLEQAAAEIQSLPLQLESMRLSALAKVAAGESQQAVQTLASAAELAARSGLPNVSSDLWMMACQGSMRLENVMQARKCWQAAVANQITAVRSRPAHQMLPTVDTVFWEQADKLKHPADQFPSELKLAFAPWYSRIGLTPNSETTSEVVLWSAIAEFQLTTGQPHLAALSIKRAEVNSSEATKPWLRIALARSMAAQGQDSVAVTILGSLNQNATPSVRAASLATLGSIKVHSGAYEQGSRFLIEALNTPQAGNWPGQLAAKADLANVRMIVGRLDEALPALHAVQNEMMTAGRWQSLCQSLENEVAILEHDGRKRDASEIRNRIQMIENG